MRTTMVKMLTKLVFTAMLAIVGITAFAGSANASRSLSINPAGAFRADSLGLLSFNSTVQGIPISVTCTVTLSGSLSRIFPKRSGTLFGKVTAVGIGPGGNGTCNPTAGQATFATVGTLPWKLVYLTFVGRLPNPNLVVFHVRAALFNIRIGTLFPAAGCDYQGDVPASILFPGTSPNVSGLIHILRHIVPYKGTDALCPRAGELVGLFALSPRQTLILVN
jgi:hypothetical protein